MKTINTEHRHPEVYTQVYTDSSSSTQLRCIAAVKSEIQHSRFRDHCKCVCVLFFLTTRFQTVLPHCFSMLNSWNVTDNHQIKHKMMWHMYIFASVFHDALNSLFQTICLNLFHIVYIYFEMLNYSNYFFFKSRMTLPNNYCIR